MSSERCLRAASGSASANAVLRSDTARACVPCSALGSRAPTSWSVRPPFPRTGVRRPCSARVRRSNLVVRVPLAQLLLLCFDGFRFA